MVAKRVLGRRIEHRPGARCLHVHPALRLTLGTQERLFHDHAVERGVGAPGWQSACIHLMHGVVLPVHVEVEPEAEEVLVMRRDDVGRDKMAGLDARVVPAGLGFLARLWGA